jgi:predicted flap endonuclease-1-like 5' DNA nuclease
MAYPIIEIQGIGEAYAAKLRAAGLRTTEAFLDSCASPKGRQATAKAVGIADGLILKWANHADLMRIRGVGGQFAELLEAAGVDTVKELKTRKADKLADRMKEVNGEKNLCKVSPSIAVVAKWIDQAKSLPAKLRY